MFGRKILLFFALFLLSQIILSRSIYAEDISQQVEKKIFNLINLERKKQGLELYKWDRKLDVPARNHSKDMFKRNFFAHENPDGLNPIDRQRRDYPELIGGVGENIHCIETTSEEEAKNVASIAKQVVKDWMNSPGHRANNLSKKYTHLGVGVYIGKKGDRWKIYTSVVFADEYGVFDDLGKLKPFKLAIKNGSEFTLKGEIYIAPSKFSAYITLPDPKERCSSSDGKYYVGAYPPKLYIKGKNFKVMIELNKGKGTYKLFFGKGKAFYLAKIFKAK